MKHAFVYVTAPSRTLAVRLARMAVDGRLAACANILPRIESVYRWKGRVETAVESALVLKTRMTLVPRLIAALRKAHPYECPCIVALPIAAGNPDFLRWIEAET
jgi:periplasmic divalent cation tolerance protein